MKLSTILFVSLLFAATLNAAPQPYAVNGLTTNILTLENETSSPKLLVVKFHADWCGSCRTLGTVITDLTNKLDGKSILFTELDFTNHSKKHQSLLLGAALGLDKVIASNNGTGFILVIDSETKEVKAKLNKTQSVKEMSKIITDLL